MLIGIFTFVSLFFFFLASTNPDTYFHFSLFLVMERFNCTQYGVTRVHELTGGDESRQAEFIKK